MLIRRSTGIHGISSTCSTGHLPGNPFAPKSSRPMQAVNNYDKEVFNGDPGYVVSVDAAARRVKVQYPSSGESIVAADSVITGSPLMGCLPSLRQCERIVPTCPHDTLCVLCLCWQHLPKAD